MSDTFPKNAAEISALGDLLIAHLKTTPDTQGQQDWTSANLISLRAFTGHGFEVRHYPPSPESNQKDAFLWDYIAYKQGAGMLIVAESEHNNRDTSGLKHDFEKLFYAIAPIKLLCSWDIEMIRNPRTKLSRR